MTVTVANLISAAAFVLTLIGACWRMSTIIQRNTDAVVALTARIDRMDAGNAKEHNEMWDKIERSEDTLNDHEARLQLLEHK
ncbi:MAG: hypothetical protein OGM61_11545 [Clostridiales bacterium]|jgi:hypothetical protein|nr:MAG: hypothetical protein OGM61_11545 [Clostridiales bacterium]